MLLTTNARFLQCQQLMECTVKRFLHGSWSLQTDRQLYSSQCCDAAWNVRQINDKINSTDSSLFTVICCNNANTQCSKHETLPWPRGDSVPGTLKFTDFSHLTLHVWNVSTLLLFICRTRGRSKLVFQAKWIVLWLFLSLFCNFSDNCATAAIVRLRQEL